MRHQTNLSEEIEFMAVFNLLTDNPGHFIYGLKNPNEDEKKAMIRWYKLVDKFV